MAPLPSPEACWKGSLLPRGDVLGGVFLTGDSCSSSSTAPKRAAHRPIFGASSGCMRYRSTQGHQQRLMQGRPSGAAVVPVLWRRRS